MKNLIIFDYDGTLVDSLIIFRKNIIQACYKHCSITISEEDFLDLFDGNMYDGMARLGILGDKIPQIIGDLRDGLSRDQEDITIFDGIDDVIRRLSEQNTLAIITSNVSDVVESYLKSKGINYFTEVLGAEKGRSKVEKINRLKSRYSGLECYYVGDTFGDIVEGKLAGAKTVAVTWGWHNEGRLLKANPNYIVRAPRELMELF